MDSKFTNLRRYNLFMGILHLVQSAMILALSNNFKLPLNTLFLEFDDATKLSTPKLDTIGNIEIGPLIAMFLMLSAIAHFFVCMPKVYDWYIVNLKSNINYVRWYEYALSSSIMIVVIAMLCGIYDLPSLILLFTLNAIMNLCGLMMELHNQTTNKTNWTAYIVGCIAGIVPWIVMGMYFFTAINSVGDVPDFLYGIFFSLFIFFNIFAINMFLQYKKIGRWKNYVFGEYIYILLSLLAKSVLAWQVFSGTLR